MTDLSIIIVNWNTREFLKKCLQSVYDTIQGLAFDVWVVDNGSIDGSTVMVRLYFPGVNLIENSENLGFARANNQAFKQCEGQFVLLLNSDAFVKDNAVKFLITAVEAHPRAGIVGGALEYPDGQFQHCYWNLPTLYGEIIQLSGLDKWLKPESRVRRSPIQAVKKVGAVSGACLLARRIMLDEIGLLDERFFMFSEEIDLCKRAWLAGWQVFHQPAAQVIHVNAGSSRSAAWRIISLYKAKLQYFAKHHGNFQTRVLYSVMHLFCKLKIFLYRIRHNDRSQLWQEVNRELSYIYLSAVPENRI